MSGWDRPSAIGGALLILDSMTGHRPKPSLDIKSDVRGHLVSTVEIPTAYVTAGDARFVTAAFARRGHDVQWGHAVREVFTADRAAAEAAHAEMVAAFGGSPRRRQKGGAA